jgi:hypothetical protein
LEVLLGVPYLFLWDTWLARNVSFFEDTQLPSFKVSAQVMGLLTKKFTKMKVKKSKHLLRKLFNLLNRHGKIETFPCFLLYKKKTISINLKNYIYNLK